MNFLRPALRGAGTASNMKLNEQIVARIAAGEHIFHMAFGQSPFPVPGPLAGLLGKHAHQAAYLNVSGCPELHTEIAKTYQETKGYSAFNESNIVVAPGSKQLIYLTMAVFDGDIFLPAPSWTTYKPQAELAGKHVVPVHTDYDNDWKLTPSVLNDALSQSSKNKMLIICNPDNPTGALYTDNEIRDISEILRKHDVLLLTDEIYSHLTFPGETFSSFAAAYPKTIVTCGFSKWLSLGGWRLGYAMFPEELKPIQDAVASAASQTHSLASVPVQLAVAEYLREHSQHVEQYTHNCAAVLQGVSDFVQKSLTSIPGVRCRKSGAGYYLFPDFENLKESLSENKNIKSGQDFCNYLLDNAKVTIMPGSEFMKNENDWNGRLCYVNFDGTKALDVFSRMPKHTRVSDEFIMENCPNVAGAMRSFKDLLKQ